VPDLTSLSGVSLTQCFQDLDRYKGYCVQITIQPENPYLQTLFGMGYLQNAMPMMRF